MIPTYLRDYRSRICFGGGDQGGGGGGGMSGGTQTTVQKADPWSGQQPYLTTGFSEAQNRMLDYTPQYYPNSTVVPYSPDTLQAMQQTEDRAKAGSPVTRAEDAQLSSTLNGDYLYGGDGFNAAVKAAMDKAQPGINSQFELAGRYGSGLNQQANTQAYADAFAGQYNDERTRQMQAMMFAPQAAEADYNDPAKLAAVGAQQESLQQQQLADQVGRWDFGQSVNEQQLQQYMNIIQGNYGGTTTTTSPLPPQYRNQSSGFLGGGMLGASIGNMIMPGLGGQLGGGLLGGLLGGFL